MKDRGSKRFGKPWQWEFRRHFGGCNALMKVFLNSRNSLFVDFVTIFCCLVSSNEQLKSPKPLVKLLGNVAQRAGRLLQRCFEVET